MNRTIHYTIPDTDSGLTIHQFLTAKGYSSQNIIALKKMPESILQNGIREHVNHPLAAKDTLTICIREEASSEKILPIEIPLSIVYEDEDLMVLDKPAGMPIHPSLNHYDYSLANGLAWYFARQNKPFIFRCINRLDRDTSGLTIIAKHMVSAGILSSMTARREIHREYQAIAKGCVTPSEGTICVPISRRPDSIIERMADFEHGERAVTHYRVLKTENGYSLVSLHLETGRTHQIRVHMKYLGYPLIGDYLYNPDTSAISRQALHSCRLTFRHPITGELMDFSSPLPSDMKAVLQAT